MGQLPGRRTATLQPTRLLGNRPVCSVRDAKADCHVDAGGADQGPDEQAASTESGDSDAEPGAERRGRTRAQLLTANATRAAARLGTLLEDVAVTRGAQLQYEAAAKKFLAWARADGAATNTTTALDVALSRYMTAKF